MNLNDLIGQLPPLPEPGPRDDKLDGFYQKLAIAYNNCKDYLKCIEHLGPTQNAELVEDACAALWKEAGKLLDTYKELHAYKVSKETGSPT